MRSFWPPGEAAQADYEALRASVLAGTPPGTPAAVRFAKEGLVALIEQPSSKPLFSGVLLGARRPAWTPYSDPRLELLAASYGLLLEVLPSEVEIQTEEVAE